MRASICMFAALGCLLPATGAQVKCSQGYYTCYYYNSCILNIYVCDGIENCYYGDDEMNCPTENTDPTLETTAIDLCADDQYQCLSGLCIPNRWICDGAADCPYYGDDERDCTTAADHSDASTEWSCPDGNYQCNYYGGCIPNIWLCDGYRDCTYGDDEQGCYDTTIDEASTAAPPPGECGSSFDYIYDRCVLVDPFTYTNWAEARYLCQKFASDLVVLDDYNFYAQLLQYIRNKGLDRHDYWVGASDKEAEGVWHWVDSSRVPFGAPLWALYGCTDDYHLEPRPSDAQSQDCGYLDKDRGLYMSDASCYESFAAICQAPRSRKQPENNEAIEQEIDP